MKEIKIKFETSMEFQEHIIKSLSHKFEFQICDKPDYVVFDNGTTGKCFQYDCIRILMIGENLRPDFNLFDYACGFDYMEFGDRYLHYPLYCDVHFKPELQLALKKHTYSDEYYLKKQGFCNFVVSNGTDVNPIREDFFEELNKYRKVDSAGRYLNNMPNGWRVPEEEAAAFRKKYKFSLAFENSAYPGYTTEKIIRAFSGDTIPIYWGDPSVTENFNSKAFVNISGYQDFERALNQIREIDSNPELFLEMVKQPIINEESNTAQIIRDEYLLQFFERIFVQEPKEVLRRINKDYGWGFHYENRQKMYQEIEDNKRLNRAFRIMRKLIK